MKFACRCLIAFSFVSFAIAGEPVSLSFENLDAFRKSDGWEVVKSVEGDPTEKRWSEVEPGAGILINGGRRGYLVGIAPAVLAALLAAQPVHCAL